MSLSKACEFVLGKPLAKNQRMSDWNQRPLTQEQVVYAALDAHCMLTILRELLTHIHVPREAQGNLGTFVGTSIRNNAPDFSKPTKKQKRIINLLQSQGWVKLFLT